MVKLTPLYADALRQLVPTKLSPNPNKAVLASAVALPEMVSAPVLGVKDTVGFAWPPGAYVFQRYVESPKRISSEDSTAFELLVISGNGGVTVGQLDAGAAPVPLP
jgi:hypothetical protein